VTDFREKVVAILDGWGANDPANRPCSARGLYELLWPIFAQHFHVAEAARAAALTLQVATESLERGGYSSSRIVERLREEGLALTMSDLYPHALNFANATVDSQALLALREAIDEHLPHYEPEHENGDYEAVVRIAGAELVKLTA
jgi:hypothetical protein